MKKFIIPAILVIAGIAIPFIGMTISPTRNLILGLAPNEAVLALADKIDENRISSDQLKTETDTKIAELQATIENQKSELANYQGKVESAKSSTEETVKNIIAENATSEKKAECEKKIADLNSKIPKYEKEKDGCEKKYKDEDNRSAAETWTENCESGAETIIKNIKKQIEKAKSECANL